MSQGVVTALAPDEESRERNGGGGSSLEDAAKQRRSEGAGNLCDGVQAWNGLCGDPPQSLVTQGMRWQLL